MSYFGSNNCKYKKNRKEWLDLDHNHGFRKIHQSSGKNVPCCHRAKFRKNKMVLKLHKPSPHEPK